MRVTGFVLCLLLLSLSAHAENPTTVAFGCAPWDGKSLELTVGAPDVSYKVTIWGRGLETLRNGGKKIAINNTSGVNSTGNGRAEACSFGNRCNPKNIKVEFKTLDLREGGEAAGLIDGTIPFQGKIADTRIFCG